jgi:uncharacterized protein
MKGVFADTSYFVALLNSHDSVHKQAASFARSFRGRFFTTDFVLIELANFLSSSNRRSEFPGLVAQLRSRPGVEIVACSRELFDEATSLYSKHRDKSWSLTDITSFIVMHTKGLTEALTTDHHFRQAGFSVAFEP